MFRTLHRQMTFFCTLITGIIMTLMSVTCLYISESGIKKNTYASFLNDVYSMVANLENQGSISYEWLAKMENNGKFIISLSNNGHSVLFDQLRSSEKRTELIDLAAEKALEDYLFTFEDMVFTSTLTQTFDFSITDSDHNDYYVAIATIPKSSGFLGATIIYPLTLQKQQITQQRFLFIGIDVLAVILLSIFSYFFTGQMIKPLKETRQKQTQFIASASHELRTPLAVILSSLSALKKADKDEEEKFTDTIQSEGLRMSRLVDDLLMLASADNQSWNMQPEDHELDTLLLDIYEKFEPLAEKKQIRLSVDLPEETVGSCRCDLVRMEQVLSILVDNAISYTPEKGRITLTLEQSASHISLKVIDNGPGVADEDKEHIFERFYRAEKSHTQKKHFGLGLCIAREIVKLHKGKIWVEDASGGGSVFVIRLSLT